MVGSFGPMFADTANVGTKVLPGQEAKVPNPVDLGPYGPGSGGCKVETTTGGGPMLTRLRRLDRHECLARLAQAEVGRLAVIDGATPMILPVNHALDGEAVVFRTDPGLKLTAGPRSPACFEVDDIDRETKTGWSVVMTGHLEEVTHYDHRTWERVTAMPIDPWAGGEKAHWMRLVPTQITGRQVRHPAPAERPS